MISNLPAGKGAKLDIPTEVTMVSKVIRNLKCISLVCINQVQVHSTYHQSLANPEITPTSTQKDAWRFRTKVLCYDPSLVKTG